MEATCHLLKRGLVPDDHVAVVNRSGHLRIYRFHLGGGRRAEACRRELLHEVKNGMDVPEDDGGLTRSELLAVAHSLSETCGITLYSRIRFQRSGAGTHQIADRRKRRAFHGVDFSPDPLDPGITEITNPGTSRSCVGSPAKERTCFIQNKLAPLNPKAVAFSRDGQFAAVSMGLNERRID